MVITYQGNDSFKISQGELSLALNPQNARGSADVTLLSAIGGEIEGKGFTISGPGEYEVKDISIKGFLSEGANGTINTIYMVNFEGLNLCFLGNLANFTLTPETLEHLEDIDILFVPVADAAASYKLAVSLEPSLIVPTSYNAESLKKFLKEAGDEGETMEKLVVKKKDLDGKEGDIVVLKAEYSRSSSQAR
jgi:L-ascorbate metabolism protein UlaG (beta-lactamase superfamily)